MAMTIGIERDSLIVSESKLFFDRVVNDFEFCEENRITLVKDTGAACLYLAARRRGLALSITDASIKFNSDIDKLNRISDVIRKHLSIQLPQLIPESFFDRLLDSVILSPELKARVLLMAKNISQLTKKEWISIGKKPQIVSIAIFCLSLQSALFPISTIIMSTCINGSSFINPIFRSKESLSFPANTCRYFCSVLNMSSFRFVPRLIEKYRNLILHYAPLLPFYDTLLPTKSQKVSSLVFVEEIAKNFLVLSEIASISSSKAIPDFFPSSFIKAQEAQKQRQEDVEALTEFLKSKFSNDDTDSQSQEKNFSDINLEYSRLMLQGISADQIVNSSWHHSLLQETAVEQENLYTQLFDFTDLDCF